MSKMKKRISYYYINNILNFKYKKKHYIEIFDIIFIGC